MKDKRGYIYFIESGGLIKIGITENLWARVYNLALSSAHKIFLKGYIEVDNDILYAGERAIHAKFDSIRAHGEWFRPSDDLYEFIKIKSISDGSEINNVLELMYENPVAFRSDRSMNATIGQKNAAWKRRDRRGENYMNFGEMPNE